MKILSGDPPPASSTHSLFNSYSKLMKILSRRNPSSFQYTFLIQFLFKIDANPLWRLQIQKTPSIQRLPIEFS